MANLSDYINRKLLHPTSTGINNIPSLDGVRGIAIIMVIACHLFAHSVSTANGFPLALNIGKTSFDIKQLLLSGTNGVRLFFVLSGFLLFMPYARRSLRGSDAVDTVKFYKRRAMRILPAYLFVIVLFTLITVLVSRSPINRINLFLNLFFIHPVFPFRNDVNPDFIPGTWSLVTEVHFYLVLPFLALFFNSFKKAIMMTLALMALSFFYRTSVGTYVADPGARFILSHNIFAHIDQFCLGMFAAFIFVRQKERGINALSWFPYVLLFLGVGTYWWIYNGGLLFIKDYETLLGLSFALFILGVVLGPSPVKRFMEWSPLRIIGLISYSMFLLNVVLAIYVLRPLMDLLSIRVPLFRLSFNMTAGVAILIFVSTISYLYIERPFLVLKKK